MAEGTHIVTGMWGTTNLVLTLVDADTGDVVSEKSGPGVSMLNGQSAEAALFSIIADWRKQYPISHIRLSGMVGSTIGWVDVPYLNCPLDARDVALNTFDFTAQGLPVSVVPGLTCLNPFGQPDVMRGEETELMSWAAEATVAQMQDAIVCIPGTHAKWVQVKDGKISSFFTSVVGEVYQVIAANGVLAKPHNEKAVQSSQAFLKAVKDIEARPQNLLNLLFSTRANTVAGDFTPVDATDYLSGLLIGADINAAVDCFGLKALKRNPVPLIGAPYLTDRYEQALDHWGVKAQTINAAEAGVKGLYAVHRGKRDKLMQEAAQ